MGCRGGVLETLVGSTAGAGGEGLRIYDKRTVLVTGDTGFKGSWLALWLLRLGARVIGYALPPNTSRDNYVQCALGDQITHFDGDVRDFEGLLSVFEKERPDIAFHLAAQALVLDSYRDPRSTFETNIMGTVNFLEAVRQTPSVRAAIVVTSDKCYENRGWVHGYRETDPMGGRDPYSSSKGAAELVAASYRRSFFDQATSAHVATVRAGNVIGGGDWAEHRIFPDCMRALIGSEPVIIRNPDSIRPWQHVLEPIHGYLTLGAKLWSEGEPFAGGWNFGPLTATPVPVRRLVEEAIARWGSGEYRLLDAQMARPKEASFLQLDISKVIHELGWTPRLSFEQMVALSVEGYRTQGLAPAAVLDQRLAQIDTYEGLTYG